MSAITERKQEVMGFLNSTAITQRITSLFEKNSKKAEKFKATVVNIALDDNLANCTVPSILKSALDIAELNLPLAKGLGQAYIVKYSSDAQPVIGYKGWLALLERGKKSVKAKPIFNCDKFKMIDNGFDETIIFKPNFEERRDYEAKWVEENLKGVLVSIRDNKTQVISNTFVSFGKIKQLASKSKAKSSKYSPYVDWNLEMYQAKATKYVCSKTPFTEDVANALELETLQEPNSTPTEQVEEPKELDLNNIIDAEVTEVEQ